MSKISKIPSHSMNNPSRRALLSAAASLAVLGLPRSAAALTEDEAKGLITTVINEVLAIVNSGQSEAAVLASFEQLFFEYADVPRIAATLLGPPWRSASSAEKNAYTQALAGYLARKYGKQFNEFKGSTIQLSKSQDFGRKGIIVESVVTVPGQGPFPVEWHVIEAGGKQSFFDIIIEGVKLLSTERSEIRALLDRNGGSVSGLANTLNGIG